MMLYTRASCAHGCTDVDSAHYNPNTSGVTPIGQGWTNVRGLRGLGAPSLTLNFCWYILIFQVLGVSHLFYSTADFVYLQ